MMSPGSIPSRDNAVVTGKDEPGSGGGSSVTCRYYKLRIVRIEDGAGGATTSGKICWRRNVNRVNCRNTIANAISYIAHMPCLSTDPGSATGTKCKSPGVLHSGYDVFRTVPAFVCCEYAHSKVFDLFYVFVFVRF